MEQAELKNNIRADFPALSLEINGHPLAFLDSGASAQKPAQVLEKMDQVYRSEYANVHRGAYSLSQIATDNYESARVTVANFLNAKTPVDLFLLQLHCKRLWVFVAQKSILYRR